MKQIREWLESGQDYAQGVALYETHGKSRVVLTALQYGATAFTRQKLVTELQKLVKPIDKLEQPALRPSRESPPGELVKKTDKLDDGVRRQRSGWLAERARLHAQLELVPTDDERRVMAERILEVSDLLTASYDEPAAAPRPDLSVLTCPGEMRRLLANLRPQRTKLLKRPDRAGDLAQVVADINLLETKLANRDGGEPELH